MTVIQMSERELTRLRISQAFSPRRPRIKHLRRADRQRFPPVAAGKPALRATACRAASGSGAPLRLPRAHVTEPIAGSRVIPPRGRRILLRSLGRPRCVILAGPSFIRDTRTAAGRGDVPLIKLRFRCSNCGSRLTNWVVTAKDTGPRVSRGQVVAKGKAR